MNRLNPKPPPAPGYSPRDHTNLKKFAGVAGVYILLVSGQLYVGSTKDLRSRLRRWSAVYPGARFRAMPCLDYKKGEQEIIDRCKVSMLSISNKVRAIRFAPRPKKAKVYIARGRGRKPCPARMITAGSRTQTLSAWCQENKIEKGLFYARLAVGWTEQEAIKPKTR